jgi:hypothetical protein
VSVRVPALVLLIVGLASGGADAASDPLLKCRQAVVRGAARLADGRLAALRKCEDAKRAGKLPALAPCAAEPKVAAAFAKAGVKLRAGVERACGGADKACGGADDVTLAALQWPGTCPELEGSGCAAPVGSCADVPACVACLADAAVSRGLALVYAPFVAADPKTEKAIVRCQRAIGTAAAGLAEKRLAVHARCLEQRLAGEHAAACPVPGDGKSAAALAAARAKAESAVCKACGGAGKRCGGGDDLALGLVGVASACPAVGTCGGPLASLGDLVACIDCTAAARGACALAGAAPGVVEAPAGCADVPPTPTPTMTPSPTLTPIATPTLTATPTPTPPPVFCDAAGSGTVTTAVTLALETTALVGSAELRLAYLPDRVRLPGVQDDAAVRARVEDLTGGELFGKGSPNNQDGDGDREPDRVRFTVVAPDGVSGAILRVTFDRCAGADPTAATDFACTFLRAAKDVDGENIPAVACVLSVAHAP